MEEPVLQRNQSPAWKVYAGSVEVKQRIEKGCILNGGIPFITFYKLLIYQVALSQPRSSMALTTRVIATI